MLDPPWSLRIEDRSPLTLVAVTHGTAWLIRGDRPPTQLGAGSIALLSGPEPYVVADAPTTPPNIVIHPGQQCTKLHGDALAFSLRLGVRTWGNANGTGETVMVIGAYEQTSMLSKELLDTLPPTIVMTGQTEPALVELLTREISNEAPGQQAFLDRLLDLLTVESLRNWYRDQRLEAPRWWQAHQDPLVGEALRALHDAPEHAWTIAELAATIGVSRANLARRFNDMLGEPPIGYLTKWRLALAADLLCDSTLSVGAVAQRVGYASPFAFSNAYKRRFGLSPHRHRPLLLQQSGQP